ncbi:MAG: thioesterase family protein [Ectothiorhodospiraceae bacterium]|jgi:thioesterase-3
MERQTHIRVRGFHLDLYGHVNNARYLEFLEEARWDQFGEQLDLRWWQSKGLAFVIVNINIDYRAAATLNDRLSISTEITKLGERSGVVHQEITRQDGARVVSADVTFTIVDTAKQRAVSIEGELREQLEKLRPAEPEAP